MFKNYVTFYDKERNRRNGIAVREHFVASLSIPGMAELYPEDEWRFRLYWKKTGYCVLENTVFSSMDGVYDFGLSLYRWYKKYLIIHEHLPNNNLFQMVKWTIPNGLFLAALFEVSDYYAETEDIVLKDILQMYSLYSNKAAQRVRWYTRGQEWKVDNYGTEVELA